MNNYNAKSRVLLMLGVVLLSLAAVLAIQVSAVQAQGGSCIVIATLLNVRAQPSTDPNNIIAHMYGGTLFVVTARTPAADWLWGTAPGLAGWANASYLSCNIAVSELPVDPYLMGTSSGGVPTPLVPSPAPPPPPPTDAPTPLAPPTVLPGYYSPQGGSALPLVTIAPSIPFAPGPIAPPQGADYGASVSVNCDPNYESVMFGGAVTAGGRPVNGAQVVFKSRLVLGIAPATAPAITGPHGRLNWPNGYYWHTVDSNVDQAKPKHLQIWVIDSAGNRISDFANWDTDGHTGTCNRATVNFFAP